MRRSTPPTAAGGGGGDPLWASVVLLAVNDNQSDGSTTFADQSAAAHSLTAVGNAQYDTAQAPTGMTSSMLSDGNGDRVTASPSADFTIPGQSKTIEFMVRSNGAWGAQEGLAWYGGTTLGWSTNTGNEWVFFVEATIPKFQYQVGGNTFATLAAGSALATDTWVHVAVTWDGVTMTLWIAGASAATSTTTPVAINTPNLLATTSDRPGTTTSALDGWFCNFRITNACRYTANFTPPSLPFPTS